MKTDKPSNERNTEYRSWRQRDLDELKRLSEEGKNAKEIAQILDKSESTTYKKMSKYGLLGDTKYNNYFTAEEDAKIIELTMQGQPISKVANTLNRETVSIWRRAKIIGLKISRKHKWDSYEEEFLKQNHNKLSLKEISENLKGRSEKAISNRIYDLGLKRREKLEMKW
jgi:hypothetical protein